MKITFATCWYKLNSKFNENTYKTWISQFILNITNCNLVIFTNLESSTMIKKILSNSKKSNIKIVIKEFENFFTWNYKTNWEKNHLKNDLLNGKYKFNTEWKLNMLWNEKINFVKDVLVNKYFVTEWYGWCDIGYFRNDNHFTNIDIRNWPNNNKIQNLKKDKIYYGQVCDDLEITKLLKIINLKNDNNLPIKEIPVNQVSIAGGFFIIYNTKVCWWHNTFYNRLEEYFKYDYLVKDDQIIIIDCIGNYKKEFELIKQYKKSYNKWFVFQIYLS